MVHGCADPPDSESHAESPTCSGPAVRAGGARRLRAAVRAAAAAELLSQPRGSRRRARCRGGGRSFTDRIKASGFDAKFAAENVGAGYHTLAEAFSGWRDSPSHRVNMLLPGATRMGIAAVYTPGSKYKVFWSLILAAPDEKRG